MAADSMPGQECTENILKNIARHQNCLAEENRNTRKRAIEGIKKELFSQNDPDVFQNVLDHILKPVLLIFSDPVEKCRELAIQLLTECLKKTAKPEVYLPVLMPILVQRLGQQDIVEPSEELRLPLVELLSSVIAMTKKKMIVYGDDCVRILQRTIADQFPEVKKESCRCASALAKATSETFHMQSEHLIKPLLTSVSHQHSRVRVEVILAIGDVLQYGNGKNVDDVVSHLAQRLFDQAPIVRSAVTKVVGGWLLDLMDRYSFHHKLIPLLLTSISDDIVDIRELAEALWYDVGMKYASENEEELKDKKNFTTEELSHYPPGLERQNLGCRELVYRHFSKILSGLLRDLGDWVDETRIKSAELLYVLLLNEEENATQHVEKILAGLYKACHDEREEVVKSVVKSAELIGYFIKPPMWSRLVLQSVKTTQSKGCLQVLAAIIRGSQRADMQPLISDICEALTDPHICRLGESGVQYQLLICVESLASVCQEDLQPVSYDIFTILITVYALYRQDVIKDKALELLEQVARSEGHTDKQELFNLHTRTLVENLKDGHALWTQHSPERLIFDTLLVESGPVVGDILEDVMPMLVVNLSPDKDPELRLKFFSLLSRLMLNAPRTIDSRQRFGDFAVTVVEDMVLPNLVWRAGRVAGAIRLTAVSCLWALLQSGIMTKEKITGILEAIMTQLKTTLEDDNKQTRLIACRVLSHVFNVAGSSIERGYLHNLYPDLLKRLDDSSDDIRVAMAKTFLTYFASFEGTFEVGLYKAHLEQIYRGLLVHLDDPEARIQDAVLDALKASADLCPNLLLEEIELVRHKHRSEKYLDMLSHHVHSLPKPES